MKRTLQRFYAIARLDFYTIRYHSKVRAIPQRKRCLHRGMRDFPIPIHRSNLDKLRILDPRSAIRATQDLRDRDKPENS